MNFLHAMARNRDAWRRGLRLAAASILTLHMASVSLAQDEEVYEEPASEVDPACEAVGIYDWDSCSSYLAGGGEQVEEEPVYDEPAYEEEAPVYEEEEPVYEEPAELEPEIVEPVYEEEPVEEEIEQPVLDETVEEDVVLDDEPVIEDEIVEDEPVVEDEAVEDEPVIQDEATEEEVAIDDAATDAGTLEDEPVAEDAADDTAIVSEEFDAEPFSDETGIQTEVIEDASEEIDPETIAPVLDSAKESNGLTAEAPEFVPEDDAQAQAFEAPEAVSAVDEDDAVLLEVAPAAFEMPQGVTVIDNSQTNVIYQVNNTTIINNYYEDQERLAYGSDAVEYYSYGDGSSSEIITADDGGQVITVRDRYGNIISRSYYDAYGNEHVLAWYDPSFRNDDRMFWYDVGYDLPPLLVTVPRGNYIFFYDRYDEAALSRFFGLPPVEPIRRLYTIDEVKRSARLRDSLPRVEIADLTFDTGSATITRKQARTLRKLADAMLASIARNPAETFLIEGHTDAPGSDRTNLRLSDVRAAAVARALTEYFGVPPWNLTTQGYGERFLKVQTSAASATNRRVTIRRITPLVTTAAR